ncbi:hypothetical protein S7335_2002 [Synechococcus sp. PCC 7335]|nr:hypothetical protein S7335_2002 [Synechococcus sp. PCC 7335]
MSRSKYEYAYIRSFDQTEIKTVKKVISFERPVVSRSLLPSTQFQPFLRNQPVFIYSECN